MAAALFLGEGYAFRPSGIIQTADTEPTGDERPDGPNGERPEEWYALSEQKKPAAQGDRPQFGKG